MAALSFGVKALTILFALGLSLVRSFPISTITSPESSYCVGEFLILIGCAFSYQLQMLTSPTICMEWSIHIQLFCLISLYHLGGYHHFYSNLNQKVACPHILEGFHCLLTWGLTPPPLSRTFSWFPFFMSMADHSTISPQLVSNKKPNWRLWEALHMLLLGKPCQAINGQSWFWLVPHDLMSAQSFT